jgi:hypothetical protein
VIVRAQAALPPGQLKVAANRGEWMRQVASFGLDVARLLGRSNNPADEPEAKALLARYGSALNIDATQLGELFDTVQQGMHGLLQSMNMEPVPKSEPDTDGDGLPNVLLLATLDAGADDGACHPSGKPKNARELLLAGVQDVTQMRAAGQGKVNEVILAVLETLYRSMGFRFATVCLKDPRAGQYRARVSFGLDEGRVQNGFAFPIAPSRDLFHLAMENNADLMIEEAPRSATCSPAGTRRCCRTRRVSSCCRWWSANCNSVCSTPTASAPRLRACRRTKPR